MDVKEKKRERTLYTHTVPAEGIVSLTHGTYHVRQSTRTRNWETVCVLQQKILSFSSVGSVESHRCNVSTVSIFNRRQTNIWFPARVFFSYPQTLVSVCVCTFYWQVAISTLFLLESAKSKKKNRKRVKVLFVVRLPLFFLLLPFLLLSVAVYNKQ